MQGIHAIQQSKDAKREIDQIGKEARQEFAQWKKTLSGTLSDKQLSTGLTLLFIFYIFYASFNSITGENHQDEDLENCTCSETHRVYYQTLVITFSVIWVICFCLITIWDLMRFLRIKPNSKCFGLEKVVGICVSSVDQIASPRSQQPILEDPSAPKKQEQKPKPEAPPSPKMQGDQEPILESSPSTEKQIQGSKALKPPASTSPQVHKSSALKSATLQRLDHYENYLWLQFNRVYSVGAVLGKHKELQLPEIKSVVADEKKIRRMSMRKMSIQVNGRLVSTADNDDEDDADELFEHMDEEDFALRTADRACSSIAFFLYPFLLIARLLAQVSLIPLLILQVLDTHAWICLMNDLYCDNLRTEYELGLDRTAISFGFYCSILVAILASTMLHWFPCSKKAEKSGAMSIA